jgi:segregation and condensation protein A
MTQILFSLQTTQFVSFESIFKVEEGRTGVVVSFIAILELLRQNLIEIIQTEIYGSIYLKTVQNSES